MKRKALLLGILLISGFEPGAKTAGSQAALQSEPVIRIGLDQNATAVTIRSMEEFTIQQQTARSARFSGVLAVDPNAPSRVLSKDDLHYRISVELDGARFLILPADTHVRIKPRTQSRTARLQ